MRALPSQRHLVVISWCKTTLLMPYRNLLTAERHWCDRNLQIRIFVERYGRFVRTVIGLAIRWRCWFANKHVEQKIQEFEGDGWDDCISSINMYAAPNGLKRSGSYSYRWGTGIVVLFDTYRRVAASLHISCAEGMLWHSDPEACHNNGFWVLTIAAALGEIISYMICSLPTANKSVGTSQFSPRKILAWHCSHEKLRESIKSWSSLRWVAGTNFISCHWSLM